MRNLEKEQERDPSFRNKITTQSASWDPAAEDDPLEFDHRRGYDYTEFNIRYPTCEFEHPFELA